jgi:hypothetical protein
MRIQLENLTPPGEGNVAQVKAQRNMAKSIYAHCFQEIATGWTYRA